MESLPGPVVPRSPLPTGIPITLQLETAGATIVPSSGKVMVCGEQYLVDIPDRLCAKLY